MNQFVKHEKLNIIFWKTRKGEVPASLPTLTLCKSSVGCGGQSWCSVTTLELALPARSFLAKLSQHVTSMQQDNMYWLGQEGHVSGLV